MVAPMGDGKKGTDAKKPHNLPHRRFGLTPQRLVTMVIVLRAMPWATGCGSQPEEGEIGGACKKEEGCGSEKTTCDIGGHCDVTSNMCVQDDSPAACPYQAGECAMEEPSCDGGAFTMACGPCQAFPSGTDDCHYTALEDDAGRWLYCCYDPTTGDAAVTSADGGDE